MSKMEQERRRLSQEHHLDYFRKEFSPLEMVPVYYHTSGGLVFASLVPAGKKEEVLAGYSSNRSWPAHIGMSGFYSVYDGIEPIVLPREFHDMRPQYQEISEEFRLFHNLYHDRQTDSYIKFDDAGNETQIAVVTDSKVEIRLKELREFLAEKGMYLCVGFDPIEQSDSGLDELGISESPNTDREDLLCWTLGFGDNRSGPTHYKAFSHLRGVRLIEPSHQKASESNAEDKKYQHFIVGLDDAGNEVTRTCDPASIYQDKGVEGYLTPVVFSQSVLDKYINQPSKYSVDAFGLRCGGLWYLRMDNDRGDGKVIVYLGDLAGLPTYEEQLHWRSHNILSEAKLSETAFKTQVLAEPAEPGRDEHVFRGSYAKLGQLSLDYLGWHLVIPLHKDDTYRLWTVRVPAHDEQKAFDDFVGNLHNILVDSLNTKELAKLVSSNVRKQKCLDGKSIALLEEVLTSRDIDATRHIEFLRDLNNLRNKVDGHRKGSSYIEARNRFGEEDDLRLISHRIMYNAVNLLEFLCEMVPALQGRQD